MVDQYRQESYGCIVATPVFPDDDFIGLDASIAYGQPLGLPWPAREGDRDNMQERDVVHRPLRELSPLEIRKVGQDSQLFTLSAEKFGNLLGAHLIKFFVEPHNVKFAFRLTS